MGCNLDEFSQCSNKCDCGNLNTLMFKGKGKNEIESENNNKIQKLKKYKYSNSKNFFQITKENDISKNIFSTNISEKNETKINENNIKEEKKIKINLHNNNKIDKQNKKMSDETDIKIMPKEIKINYINNCMNNVTIEDKDKNQENSSIYEDNKDSFINMENNKNDDNEKRFDKLQCSGIEEKIDKSSEDIKDVNIHNNNIDEDLFDVVNMINKEDGNNNNEIEFEGEKCIFNGNLIDKKNICGKGKINLQDGRSYEGTFVNGKLEGEGTYINNKGDIYIGHFNSGKINGKGKIIKKKENLYKSNGIHITEIKNNIIDNNEDNNLVYEGEINDFKKEGYGIETCLDYKYEGNFHDDMKNGQGSIIYFKKGRKYKGEFNNDEITGYGYLVYENKQTYKGDLVNGKKEGKGIYNWPEGCEYKGEYKNDIKEGEGIFKWANGIIFKGKFSRGKPDGKGLLIYKDKNKEVKYIKGKFVGNLNETIKDLKNSFSKFED